MAEESQGGDKASKAGLGFPLPDSVVIISAQADTSCVSKVLPVLYGYAVGSLVGTCSLFPVTVSSLLGEGAARRGSEFGSR